MAWGVLVGTIFFLFCVLCEAIQYCEAASCAGETRDEEQVESKASYITSYSNFAFLMLVDFLIVGFFYIAFGHQDIMIATNEAALIGSIQQPQLFEDSSMGGSNAVPLVAPNEEVRQQGQSFVDTAPYFAPKRRHIHRREEQELEERRTLQMYPNGRADVQVVKLQNMAPFFERQAAVQTEVQEQEDPGDRWQQQGFIPYNSEQRQIQQPETGNFGVEGAKFLATFYPTEAGAEMWAWQYVQSTNADRALRNDYKSLEVKREGQLAKDSYQLPNWNTDNDRVEFVKAHIYEKPAVHKRLFKGRRDKKSEKLQQLHQDLSAEKIQRSFKIKPKPRVVPGGDRSEGMEAIGHGDNQDVTRRRNESLSSFKTAGPSMADYTEASLTIQAKILAKLLRRRSGDSGSFLGKLSEWACMGRTIYKQTVYCDSIMDYARLLGVLVGIVALVTVSFAVMIRLTHLTETRKMYSGDEDGETGLLCHDDKTLDEVECDFRDDSVKRLFVQMLKLDTDRLR